MDRKYWGESDGQLCTDSCVVTAGDESGESTSLTPTEAFTRFVEMKALYQKERAATRRNEIMLDQLAVHMETKLMEIHQEKVTRSSLRFCSSCSFLSFFGVQLADQLSPNDLRWCNMNHDTMYASYARFLQPMRPLHAIQAACVGEVVVKQPLWGRLQMEHGRIREAYSSLAFSLEGADSQKKELESRLSQSQANVAREGRERSCVGPTHTSLPISENRMDHMEILRSAEYLVDRKNDTTYVT